MRDRLVAVEKGHVAEIDFPVEGAGSARIVGVVGRAALGKCWIGEREKENDENQAAQYPWHYCLNNSEGEPHELAYAAYQQMPS
jgi:hypothetical protein